MVSQEPTYSTLQGSSRKRVSIFKFLYIFSPHRKALQPGPLCLHLLRVCRGFGFHEGFLRGREAVCGDMVVLAWGFSQQGVQAQQW